MLHYMLYCLIPGPTITHAGMHSRRRRRIHIRMPTWKRVPCGSVYIYQLQLNPTLITNDVNNRVRNGHFVPHQPRPKFNWWTKKLLTTGSRQSRGGIYTVKPSSIKLHLTFKCTQWPSGKRRKTFVRHLTSFRALKERETKCPITEPIRVLFLIKLRGENATSLSIYRKISGRCNLESRTF